MEPEHLEDEDQRFWPRFIIQAIALQNDLVRKNNKLRETVAMLEKLTEDYKANQTGRKSKYACQRDQLIRQVVVAKFVEMAHARQERNSTEANLGNIDFEGSSSSASSMETPLSGVARISHPDDIFGFGLHSNPLSDDAETLQPQVPMPRFLRNEVAVNDDITRSAEFDNDGCWLTLSL